MGGSWLVSAVSEVAQGVDGVFYGVAVLGELGEEPGEEERGEGRLLAAFAAAVARHFRRPGVAPVPKLVGIEPANAACLFESIAAERIVSVPGPHDSIMAGLNCGRPSLVAWPTLYGSVDLLVSVGDEPVREAMRLAAGSGIVSGETGASGLGGLLALLRTGEGEEAHRELGVDGGTRVLVFNTEGATDPKAYQRTMSG